MDYTLNREAITANETIFDGCQEQPIDLDFSLPDYCPDIQRILKCQVYPCITSRNILGDHLEVEGTATVKVLYLDPAGSCIRCCENSRPFSASIALKKDAENAVAFTKTRVEYINCRATSPRRLDIHGAFSVCARVVERTENQLVSAIEGDDIQQKKRDVSASRVKAVAQQQFSVSEVLEISDGKPAAENIIRSGASAAMQDFKVVSNKLIVKGEISLKLLYASEVENSLPEAMEYVIPFSQMLDCDGLTEECTCDVSLDVMSFDVRIKSDSSGENTLFEAEIKLIAGATAYEDTTVPVVTDAYSTDYELSVDYKMKTIPNLVEIISDNSVQKNSFDLGDAGISKVIDIWNEMSTVTAEEESGQILYKGKMNLCILALNAESKPFYFERVVDFTGTHDWLNKPSGVRCEPSVNVSNIGYRITGESGIEIKAELKLTAAVFLLSTCKVISDVSADETHVKQKDTSAALTIYYADAGESLWDIARTYCTSVEAIKSENDLTEESVENRGMLLIPM